MLDLLSSRINAIEESATLKITSKAKALKKQGENVVNFGAGEPDFDTPDAIKSAAKKALDDGITKYTPTSGMIELKEAICEKFKTDNDLDYKPENIVVSCGAKHSLYNLFQVLCDEGDEVIIPAPFWVSYPQFVKLAGGTPVIVQTTEENGFVVDIEELQKKITPKTKILVLNSPSNPTGTMYDSETLQKIAALAVENRILVFSDEIYEKIVYSKEHVSIASLGDEIKRLSVVINGVSKAYSMTGWRIGYLAAEKQIAQAVDKLQSQSTSNPTSIAQVASVEALRGDQSCVNEMLKAFRERRDYLVNALNEIPGVMCRMPEGAFYVFANISSFGIPSMELAERLLDTAKVAVIPGSAFGAEGFIRMSYATSLDEIKEGVKRIGEFLGELK